MLVDLRGSPWLVSSGQVRILRPLNPLRPPRHLRGVTVPPTMLSGGYVSAQHAGISRAAGCQKNIRPFFTIAL